MRNACLITLTLLLVGVHPAMGLEIKSRFADLNYTSPADLSSFNRELQEGFGFGFGGGDTLTIANEVRDKLDKLATRVQEILDMYPAKFHYRVTLVENQKQIDDIYDSEYHSRPGFIAYFSPKSDTIYVSLEDVSRRVFAHELAHAVIHHYFHRAPPTKIHELLAQYVEEQL